MRTFSHAGLALILALASSRGARGQSPSTRGHVTAMASSAIATVGGCAECEGGFGRGIDAAITLKTGLTVGARALRWSAFDVDDQTLSTVLLTSTWYPFRDRRANGFLQGGIGSTSVSLFAHYGGHYSERFEGKNLATFSLGTGVDLRIYRRLAISPFIRSTRTVAGQTDGERCAAVNYMSGDFTPVCSSSRSVRPFHLNEVGIGIGLR